VPVLLVFLLLFYLLYPIYGVFQYVRPPRLGVRFAPPQDHGARYREVTFNSPDGLRLAGWYAPSRNGAAVILVHGYGGNRLAMLAHAKMLAARGYGVLLYDMRAHGASEGRLFAAGWDAVADVQGALAYLQRQMGVRRDRVGVLGVSVGGQVALRAAAQNGGLGAVVADGPNPSTRQDVYPPRSALGWFYAPLNWVHEKALAWQTGVPVPAALCEEMPRIAPRPVLLISTGRGNEQRFARKLHAAGQKYADLWELPNAHHAGGWLAQPEAYAARIGDFFDAALLAEA